MQNAPVLSVGRKSAVYKSSYKKLPRLSCVGWIACHCKTESKQPDHYVDVLSIHVTSRMRKFHAVFQLVKGQSAISFSLLCGRTSSKVRRIATCLDSPYTKAGRGIGSVTSPDE
eukprot:5869587-Amphidinium_carterae.1